MKVGLAACSNGHSNEWASQIDELEEVLDSMGIETVRDSPFGHIIIEEV